MSSLRRSLLLLCLVVLAACRAKSAPSHPSSNARYGVEDAREYRPGPSGGATVSSEPAPDYGGDDRGGWDGDEEARVSSVAPNAPSPGLGTEFGEYRESHAFTTRFVRASRRPETTLALWYNDWSGIDAAASWHGAERASSVGSPSGALVVSLLDELGRPLPAVDVGGQRYAVGEPGQRYQIAIANNSSERWEVVASVDGLDVIDGRTAAFHKRGYVVDPWSSITIDGWRTSDASIAAFRFGDLPDSYAARKGEARNVGVIGVAFFRERGARPHVDDVHRRHTADPFPGRFAAPPPPRGW